MNEAASDSESSDSETCPKLSQGTYRRKNLQQASSLLNHRSVSLNNNPYSSRPLSVTKSVMDPVEKGKLHFNGIICQMVILSCLLSSKETSNLRSRTRHRSMRQQFLYASSTASNRSSNGFSSSQRHGPYANGSKYGPNLFFY